MTAVSLHPPLSPAHRYDVVSGRGHRREGSGRDSRHPGHMTRPSGRSSVSAGEEGREAG